MHKLPKIIYTRVFAVCIVINVTKYVPRYIVFNTHILIFSMMISTLYRGKNTRIIKVNPFHDDTSADEKYRVFRDGAIVERINFQKV
jgi:hypothetical protein